MMTITIYVTFPMGKTPPNGWFSHTGLLYAYTVGPDKINDLIQRCFKQKCSNIEIGSIFQKFPLDKQTPLI